MIFTEGVLIGVISVVAGIYMTILACTLTHREKMWEQANFDFKARIKKLKELLQDEEIQDNVFETFKKAVDSYENICEIHKSTRIKQIALDVSLLISFCLIIFIARHFLEILSDFLLLLFIIFSITVMVKLLRNWKISEVSILKFKDKI